MPVVIYVYSSLRGLTAPAIRLRAYLRRVLNVFNNNNNNNNNCLVSTNTYSHHLCLIPGCLYLKLKLKLLISVSVALSQTPIDAEVASPWTRG